MLATDRNSVTKKNGSAMAGEVSGLTRNRITISEETDSNAAMAMRSRRGVIAWILEDNSPELEWAPGARNPWLCSSLAACALLPRVDPERLQTLSQRPEVGVQALAQVAVM